MKAAMTSPSTLLCLLVGSIIHPTIQCAFVVMADGPDLNDLACGIDRRELLYCNGNAEYRRLRRLGQRMSGSRINLGRFPQEHSTP
jgi:hypothetical protein